jgi:hypothetical protein
MATWVPLPWDTAFFGVSIGKVDLDGADVASIVEMEQDARAAGVVCLYGSVDPADRQLTYEVQACGWRLVDVATMHELALDEPPIPRPGGVTFRAGTAEDLPGMRDVVAKLADWSRFAVDPRFGRDAAERLQHAWIERAATSSTGEHVLLVAEAGSEVVAFISLTSTSHPVVDTVGTTAQGSGAARHLMQTARDRVGDQPLLGGPIAARNVLALRFVGRCGYRITSTRYLYHRWLDEEAVAHR